MHREVYIIIGLNIRYYRKRRKMKQATLAELSGYSHAHIQRIEAATSVPSLNALLDISQVLGITLSQLFDMRQQPKAALNTSRLWYVPLLGDNFHIVTGGRSVAGLDGQGFI